jgi:hypothetical protein
MIDPFEWWLLIVGLAAGAGLAWLVLADLRRREEDLDERERADEAGWIAATLEAQGRGLPPQAVEDVLSLHRWYLREPPRVESPGEAAGGGLVYEEGDTPAE